MKKLNLKSWETILMGASLLIFFVCLWMYVSDFPLRNYLFDLTDQEGQKQVGNVEKIAGSLRREIQGDSEFKSVSQGQALFDADTVVTDSSGGATLKLNDGGTIDLGAGSMVKLTFVDTYSLGGIARVANIQVIAGNVEGHAGTHEIVLKSGTDTVVLAKNSKKSSKLEAQKAAKIAPSAPAYTPRPTPSFSAIPSPTPKPSPSPSPSPSVNPMTVTAILLSPRAKEKLSLPKNANPAELPVQFKWKVTPLGIPIEIQVQDLTRGTHLASKEETDKSTLSVTLKKPGLYRWELKSKGGTPLQAQVNFEVMKNFIAIETLDPLVSGQKMSDNTSTTQIAEKFDVTLHWKPYAVQKDYTIETSVSSDMQKITSTETVSELSYQVSQNEVFNGRVYYRVSTQLRNGFVATSPVTYYEFKYLSPQPVLPVDRSVISRKDRLGKEKGVLFTWRSTSFTEVYEIEIARDLGFQNLLIDEKVKENFYVFKLPENGIYYWRVLSHTKTITSPPSAVQKIEITD